MVSTGSSTPSRWRAWPDRRSPGRAPRALRLAELVDDGQAPVPAERARGDLHADRALAALVFVAVDHRDDLPHDRGIEAVGDDVGQAPVLLDVGLEDRVEHLVRRQEVL